MATPFLALPSQAVFTPFPQTQQTGGTGFDEEVNVVNAICELSNGTVYFGGGFDHVTDEKNVYRKRAHLAVWGANNRLQSGKTSITGTPAARTGYTTLAPFEAVNAITPNSAETKLYIGGAFTQVNGLAYTNIVRISASTGIADSWKPQAGGGVNPVVRTVETSAAKVFLGGKFLTVAGQTSVNLACVSRDLGASLVSGWSHDFDNDVNKIVIDAAHSKLYVFGKFQSVDGQSRIFAAEFNLTTGALTSWAPNWNPVSGQGVGAIDACMSPDGNYLLASTGGSGTTDCNAAVCWKRTNGVFSPTPSWKQHAAVDEGNHQAIACNNVYGWVGHHGNGDGSHDAKLYGFRLTDGVKTRTLSGAEHWEQSVQLNGTRGTWALHCGPHGLYVGGGQTTPRRGIIKYSA